MTSFKSISLISIAILGIMMLFDFLLGIELVWYFMVLALWLILMAIGTFSMSWNTYLPSLTENSSMNEKKIAITFDDGPHPKYTQMVLQLLKEFNAKASFFCIGKNVEEHPEILKNISAEGHFIGNHSYSHNLGIDFSSTEGWLKELKDTDEVINKTIGKRPEYFRPPFGVTTPPMAKAIEVTGHQVIGWNIRSFDRAIGNPQIVLKRILRRIRPGAIILLHDSHPNIRYILEHLLQFLQQHNYKMVTVHELFEES